MLNKETRGFKTFEQSLPIVAAALGKHCGVNIEMGGNEAFTDGRTIHLPYVNVDRQPSSNPYAAMEAERQVLGLLCHEAAHVRFTDMNAVRKAAEGTVTAFEHALDNSLEDIRVERAMCSEYLGVDGMLQAAHQPIVEKLTRSLRLKGRDLIPLSVLCHAELQIMGREWLRPLSEKLHERMVQTYGRKLTEELERLSLKVQYAQSTADVQDIRREMMTFIVSERNREQKTSCDGRTQDHQSENAAEGTNASQSSSSSMVGNESELTKLQTKEEEDGDQSRDSAQQPEGKPNRSTVTDESGSEPSQASSCSEMLQGSSADKALAELINGLSQPVDNPLDLSKAFRKLKSSSLNGSRKGEENSSCSGTSKLTLCLNGKIRPQPRTPGTREIGLRRLEQAKADSVMLRHALQGLVQADSRNGIRITDRGRKFVSTKLHRLVTGCSRVFLHRDEKKAPDTAIHLLLDMSGSMGSEGGDLALRTGLGLIHGLQQIKGVNAALSIFPGLSCGQSQYATVPLIRHGERLSRIDPTDVGAVESYGSTPLFEALLTARMDLVKCRERMKAVLVVTDGRLFNPACSEAVQQMTEAGIRVMGIQIAEEMDLDKVIPGAVLIHEIADLKSELFRLAKSLLLKH